MHLGNMFILAINWEMSIYLVNMFILFIWEMSLFHAFGIYVYFMHLGNKFILFVWKYVYFTHLGKYMFILFVWEISLFYLFGK